MVFRDNNVLDDECFCHASVRAMVNRLHAIHPEQVPKSAEVFYIRDEQRFAREAMTFIAQNRREGFVGDMFTFSYVFAELFGVDVHLYHPEETTLSIVAFAKYHLYLRYHEGKFNLMLPQLQQVQYVRPTGLIRTSSRASLPLFRLTSLEKSFVPPNILDYRVHHLCIYDVGLHCVELIRGTAWSSFLSVNQYAYVVGKVLVSDSLQVLSCVSSRGQCGPRFYVDVVPFQLYVIVESSIEEALKAIRIERLY
jgi:hypothetical protein